MNIPLICTAIWLVITASILGIHLARNGEKCYQKNALTKSFFMAMLYLSLEYGGGAYNALLGGGGNKIPAIILAVITIMSFSMLTKYNNKEMARAYAFFPVLIGTLCQSALLYWAGFFNVLLK